MAAVDDPRQLCLPGLDSVDPDNGKQEHFTANGEPLDPATHPAASYSTPDRCDEQR